MRLISLVLSMCLPAVATPERERGIPQDEPTRLTLDLVAKPKKGSPTLRVKGKANLPDGTVLRAVLSRLEERWLGSRLLPEPLEGERRRALVEGKAVAFQFAAEEPGRYRVRVELRDDDQEPGVLPALKSVHTRKWEVEFVAWEDDYAAALGRRLAEVDDLVEEALKILDGFSSATASRETWESRKSALDKSAEELLKKAERAGARAALGASVTEILLAVRNLKGNASFFQFGEDGKFAGAVDYRTKKPAKTARREDWSFQALRKDLQGVREVSGREFSAAVVAEARRSGKVDALGSALRDHAAHAGVAPFAERLRRLPEGADALEREVRTP